MTTQKIPFKDRIIPWYFVLFFIILAIVNVIFVTLATQSHPGVVIDNAYETGLNYNDIISASEAQENLGWKSNITIKDNKLIILVTDKDNKSLVDAIVKISVKSVLQEKKEIFLSLSETSAGRYSVPFHMPHKGRWDIYAVISKGGDVMQVKERIIVE